MKRTLIDYIIFGIIAIGIFAVVIVAVNRVRSEKNAVPLSRAIDTVNIGTTANDGTGDPLRTAFMKVNDVIIMLDSLDVDSLTNAEVYAIRNTEELEDAVLFYIGDTTVTAALGKVVFKTSDSHFYGCVALTAKKWKQLDN